MRTSLLNLDQVTTEQDRRDAPAPPRREEPAAPQTSASQILDAAPSQPAASAPAELPQSAEAIDYEIVLGRRQLASSGLLLIVAVACVSGVSYLIGKSAAAKTQAAPITDSKQAAASAPAPAGIEPPAAKPSPALAPVEVSSRAIGEAPVYADATPGNVYIQVGAIEKGLAGIWAEGLRTHGLNSFASPGPSNGIWRVLVGPLPDPPAYQFAKDTLDRLGVSTFGRRYTEEQRPPSQQGTSQQPQSQQPPSQQR